MNRSITVMDVTATVREWLWHGTGVVVLFALLIAFLLVGGN